MADPVNAGPAAAAAPAAAAVDSNAAAAAAPAAAADTAPPAAGDAAALAAAASKPGADDLNKPATALSGDDDQNKGAAPPTWPTDWREKLAKGDDKRTNIFSRYASPEAMADALVAAQTKIRSGDLKSGKPAEGAKPEEMAEWRKQNEIPATAAEYDLTLDDGLVIGDGDKPLVDKMLAVMHGVDLPQATVKPLLNAFFAMREEEVAQRRADDLVAKKATEDALREEWLPGEYRANLNTVSSFLSSAPNGLGDKLAQARFADGTPVFSDPDTLRWMLAQSNEINPAHTVVPGAGANAGTAIADEITGLKTKMGDKKSDYWVGPNAEKNQARYRELIDAQSKMANKAA